MKATLMMAAAALSAAAGGVARADLAEYYIGIDSRTNPFSAPSAVGGGAYPNNPNNNRLTFLYQHGDHYHGIGQYVYTGPAATPTLMDTNGNNRLPETFASDEGLPLLPGVAAYAGKNVTTHVLGLTYSDLEVRSVHSLDTTDIEQGILFNSSAGRWSGAFDAADIHLELVGVSSPWLNVGTPSDPNALPVGGNVHVGGGDDDSFSFTPVLWVDASAPVGDYWAEFRLVDESGTYGSSGRFFLDVQQVPEPAALGMVALAAAFATVKRVR